MAHRRIKTEHAGAKNGGGAWMTRAEAKETAKRKRREIDKQAPDDGRAGDDWGDLDEFSARSSTLALRRLDKQTSAPLPKPRNPASQAGSR